MPLPDVECPLARDNRPKKVQEAEALTIRMRLARDWELENLHASSYVNTKQEPVVKEEKTGDGFTNGETITLDSDTEDRENPPSRASTPTGPIVFPRPERVERPAPQPTPELEDTTPLEALGFTEVEDVDQV